MRYHRKTVWAAVSLVVLLAASGAVAEQIRVPGHMCRYYTTTAGDSKFSPSGYKAVGLKNLSSVSRNVACPVWKNYFRDTAEAAIVMSSNAATCRLYWRLPDGTDNGYWYSNTPVSIGNGRYEYRWTPSSALDTYGKSLSIYCSVPSGAVIENYSHADN